jgi:HSP20 family protein
MFEDFQPSGGQFEGLGGGTFAPALDVKENADSYIVSLEVPGIAQDDLNISLENNVLTVRGQKQQKHEEKEGEFRRVERSYGSFARSVTLPRTVESGKVSASLNDGVLQIELPKEEQAKPRQISIGATHES